MKEEKLEAKRGEKEWRGIERRKANEKSGKSLKVTLKHHRMLGNDGERTVSSNDMKSTRSFRRQKPLSHELRSE